MSHLTCRQADTVFLLPGNTAQARTISQRVYVHHFIFRDELFSPCHSLRILTRYINFPPLLSWRLHGVDLPTRSGTSWHSPRVLAPYINFPLSPSPRQVVFQHINDIVGGTSRLSRSPLSLSTGYLQASVSLALPIEEFRVF